MTTTASRSEEKGIRRAIARVYAGAVLAEMHDPLGRNIQINAMEINPADATQLRAELDGSKDPALLSEVGTVLVQFYMFGADAKGVALIQKAISLDPTNPAWREALASAQAERVRRQNEHIASQAASYPSTSGQSPAIRVGRGVAESNLLTHLDPIYPPLALQARIQGVVEFTVVIDATGKVEQMTLVRGHPMLVNAAKDALARGCIDLHS